MITYDPRGMERSTREPGSELTVEVHAEDYHRVIEAAGLGPVDAFGSSGGVMCALHWVVAHPEDVVTLVSHEPPLTALLEDREMAIKVNADLVDNYQRAGYGPAMAKFIQLVMHQAPLPDDYLDRPAPDPAQFGLPTEDDGSRDDLLLSGNLAMLPFTPDAAALRASPVRVIPAIGELGEGGLARRGGEALAQLLGVEPVIFPGDHGGFAANEWSPKQRPGRVRRETGGAARRVGHIPADTRAGLAVARGRAFRSVVTAVGRRPLDGRRQQLLHAGARRRSCRSRDRCRDVRCVGRRAGGEAASRPGAGCPVAGRR